jgi:SAM-dependent methyltransferase
MPGMKSSKRALKAAKQAWGWTLKRAGGVLRPVLPLRARRSIVGWLGRRKWPGQHLFSIELVRDFAKRDASGFHRFLWSNHLAYAQNYELARQFGAANLHASRRMLFTLLADHLRARGIDPHRDVHSVFEVGCSLGYLLRFAETDIFHSATLLRGLDIDAYAVDAGARYLRQLGSKVELVAADMTDADQVMGKGTYDVVLCCGVLMYLEETLAARVVDAMLRHAGSVVALMGVAHPEIDNAGLVRSEVRRSDETFIHNLDAMVRNSGGRVAFRRWEGPRMVGGNSIYIVLAEPVASDSLAYSYTPGKSGLMP